MRLVALALCLLACRAAAFAQSADLSSPTPVTGPEIAGVISPLDIGDSRLTRHFYTFGGGQGDVELTIDSNNLEGDIDIFAAAGLRPLAKITLYPGLNSGIARTVYLRRAETLVLRVQARSPNDSDGSYRIRLGGTFIPAAAAASAAEPAAETQSAATSAASGAGRKGRRVSSVGARIEEPKVEVAVEFEKPAAPEPTPEAAAPTERPTPARRGAARTSPNTRTPARTGAARRGASRGAARPPAATPAPESGERTGAAAGEEKPAPESADERPADSARGRASRSGRARPAPAASAAPAPTGLELPGTRLVLELREGGQFVREMAEVRRVTIERGHVVVLLKSGRAERYALSNVLRMSIEP